MADIVRRHPHTQTLDAQTKTPRRNLVIVSQMISGAAAQIQVHQIGNFGVAINLIATHSVGIEVDSMFYNKRMKPTSAIASNS